MGGSPSAAASFAPTMIEQFRTRERRPIEKNAREEYCQSRFGSGGSLFQAYRLGMEKGAN